MMGAALSIGKTRLYGCCFVLPIAQRLAMGFFAGVRAGRRQRAGLGSRSRGDGKKRKKMGYFVPKRSASAD